MRSARLHLRRLPALALLALAPFLLGSPGLAPAQDSAKPKPSARPIEDQMLGLWMLEELDWPELRDTQGGMNTTMRGCCLVAQTYLTIEIHVGLFSPEQTLRQLLFDSGTWRFDVLRGRELQLSSVVGSFLNKADKIEFRAPGTRHDYMVEVLGERMILNNAKGQRMIFERVPEVATKRRDVFGREIKPKPEEEKPKR